MNFEEWCAELDRVAMGRYEYPFPVAGQDNRECWRGHYDDGSSPEQALLEAEADA